MGSQVATAGSIAAESAGARASFRRSKLILDSRVGALLFTRRGYGGGGGRGGCCLADARALTGNKKKEERLCSAMFL